MVGKAKVAVIGVGSTTCTRVPKHSLGMDALAAARIAIADAGLRPEQVDGITSFPYAPYGNAGNVDGVDIVTPDWIAARLQLDVRWMETNRQIGRAHV